MPFCSHAIDAVGLAVKLQSNFTVSPSVAFTLAGPSVESVKVGAAAKKKQHHATFDTR